MYSAPRIICSASVVIREILCPKIGSHSAALINRCPPGIGREYFAAAGNPAPPAPITPASRIASKLESVSGILT